MSDRPWFPFYVGQFEVATRHLTATQVGAFVRLLAHQWEHRAIPNDPGARARIAGVHPPLWGKIWEALSPLFTPSPVDQRLSFDPLVKEYVKSVEISNNNKRGGIANAHTRARGLQSQSDKVEKESLPTDDSEKIVFLDSASQGPPSAGRKAVTEFDLVLSDGTIIEHEEFEAINQQFGITNSRDRAGAAKRNYLKDCPGQFFLDRFRSQLSNHKFRKKVLPAPTPAEKQAAVDAATDRYQKTEDALAVRNRIHAKQRTAGDGT